MWRLLKKKKKRNFVEKHSDFKRLWEIGQREREREGERERERERERDRQTDRQTDRDRETERD